MSEKITLNSEVKMASKFLWDAKDHPPHDVSKNYPGGGYSCTHGWVPTDYIDSEGYQWVEIGGSKFRFPMYGPCLVCGEVDGLLCIDDDYGIPCAKLVPLKTSPTFPQNVSNNPSELNNFILPHMPQTPYSLCGMKISKSESDQTILEKMVMLGKNTLRNQDDYLTDEEENHITAPGLKNLSYTDAIKEMWTILRNISGGISCEVPKPVVEEEFYPMLGSIYKLFFPDPINLQAQCLKKIEGMPSLRDQLPAHIKDHHKVSYWYDSDPDGPDIVPYGDKLYLCTIDYFVKIDRNENAAIGLMVFSYSQ